MSINVFKEHPGNKVTFSDRSVFCGEHKVVGSRPKVIFCDMLFIVHYVGEQFLIHDLLFLPISTIESGVS